VIESVSVFVAGVDNMMHCVPASVRNDGTSRL